MTVLLHLSDTHFGTEQAVVVEALLRLAQQQRPALAVLSGDITQRARPAQFHAARAFVDRLGVPALVIPGNHDIALFDVFSRLLRPYARHVAAFGPELEPMHASDGLLVIGVNTTRPWRHKHGELSEAQVARVAARLASAQPRQLRVVVVHQPVAVVQDADQPDLLRGHAAAVKRWAAAGADLVLGGHIHLPYVVELQGLARPLWVAQAGTAVSSRVRAGVPNSVNLLRWQPSDGGGDGDIEQWDFSAAAGHFVCVKRTRIQPARNQSG